MAAPIEIRVPDLGGFADVLVIDVLVKEGETIDVDTPLITLETEKATMDVPSTGAGRVVSLKVNKGSKVSQGSVILQLEPAAGAQAAPAPASTPAPAAEAPKSAAYEPTVRQPALSMPPPEKKQEKREPDKPASVDTQRTERPAPAAVSPPPAAAPAAQTPAATVIAADFSGAHASPSVRKFARELGVDLTRIKGSGVKGRITPDDVKTWVKQKLTAPASAPSPAPTPAAGSALPKIPAMDFSAFGPIEVKPLGRIQKISGPHLHASWVNIPHVWQMDEADITDLEETRNQLKGKAAKEGIKLTPLAFILRACVKALQEFPTINSSLDAGGAGVVLKKYIHLGFAADTPNGLVVPVIRDADKKDVYEIARDLADLSEKARAGKLKVTEMQGGSFTVSSLGSIGGTAFTPIINAPQAAILGVARSSMKPVYKDGGFVPRLMLPFTLAYDHRIIDGAMAVRFTTYLAQRLADAGGLVEAIP